MHLGVLLHWLVSAIAVGKDRDTTGWKACGSIPASLNKAPFLRFCRTLEIAESTVGGAFLHGAELSDSFVSLFSLSVPREFSGWILGFGSKPRADRLLGWLELRDLAVQATARAIRTLHDAQRLLALAIAQLHYNWESSRSSGTRYGALLREIRKVWPRFPLISSSPVQWNGAPPVDSVNALGRRF